MNVALFAEVDPNLVEGPAIWLTEVARLLASLDSRVTVLLREPRARDEVLGALDRYPGIEIVSPDARDRRRGPVQPRLSPRQAVQRLERLDAADRFDVVLVRGRRTARLAALSPALRDRLACYITDLPDFSGLLGEFWRRRLGRSLRGAPLLLCQTPEIAASMRRCLPDLGQRKIALLPPIAADEAFEIAGAGPPARGERLRLVYIGKFARAWNTVEMTELPELLTNAGIAAEIHVAGNKFLTSDDRGFPARMRRALQQSGVVWHGGLTRRDALRLAATGHIGLSWRSPSLDGSPELSTKLLDYGALGLPVLCNPTPMHRRLLGEDYPLFAARADEALMALGRCARDRNLWQRASNAVARLAAQHRSGPIGAGLSAALAEAFGAPSQRRSEGDAAAAP